MKAQVKKISSLILPLLLFFGLTASGSITVTPNLTPACHDSTGAVTFSVTGGTGSYTYILYDYANGGYYQYPAQSSPTFIHLYAGLYYVYVYGGQDSTTLAFTVPTLVQGTFTITNATCTQSNGTVKVTPSGGTGPYSYQWSNTITNIDSQRYLAAGGYAVTITDANGCVSGVDSLTAVVAASSPVSVSIVNSGTACNQTLVATPTGGTAPYIYAWSDTGAVGGTLSNIHSTGTYTVTATDQNGCTGTQSFSVLAPGLTIDSLNSIVTNPGCNGTTGSILIAMSNGARPFTYQWSNGAVDSVASGLAAGQYAVTVTDANGCSGTQYYYLGSTAVAAYISVNNNPTCGISDGALSAYAYYGNGNYTFHWSNNINTFSQVGLPAGTYTVTATDGNGCTAMAVQTLYGVANFNVSVTTTPTACDTSVYSGTATAVITGAGTPPYFFAWYNGQNYWGGGTIIGTTQTITNLSYNTYLYVNVTDANGCIPSGGNAVYDSFPIMLDPACYDHISGYVYYDSNSNCIMDAHEHGLTGAYITAVSASGSTYYGNVDSTGFYDVEVMPGIYTVSVSLYTYGSCTISTCVTSYTDTFTTTGQISSGNNFGTNSGSPTFDLGVHMGYLGSQPGQQREYWVYYYNWGQTSVANGVLTFVHDPNITLVSTTPAYTSYNAATQTITWDIVNNLAPMFWLDAQHQVIMYFDIPSTVTLGTMLTAAASISPVTGDCDPSNNSQYLVDPVTASHDPNEKEVSPAGNLSASDTVLTYSIRFQNNGNAPANTIIVSDTLSSNVDPATVQPGASSAPYKFTMSGRGVLTFTFQGINLPDSAHGDSSRGFVMYTVHTKKNLPIGSQINNTAFIYFDANTPIVTNTTVNVRSDHPNGISTINANAMTAIVVPNPAHEQALIELSGATGNVSIQITDALGNTIQTGTTDSNIYKLDAQMFASGIYFYRATDANGNKASGKISIVH